MPTTPSRLERLVLAIPLFGALEPRTLISSSLLPCLMRSRDLASQMVIELSHRMRGLMTEIEHVTTYSGMERLIALLLAELPADATGPAAITIPAKKRIIASRVNATHEHWSRMLAELCRDGFISMRGPQLAIRGVERLRERLSAAGSARPE